GNVYLLAGGQTNVAVQIGRDGVLLVDAPPPDRVAEAMTLIRRVSSLPIRYLISTAADAERISGDEALGPYAEPMPGNPLSPDLAGEGGRVAVLAQENVLNRLDARTPDGRSVIAGAIVTDEYATA